MTSILDALQIGDLVLDPLGDQLTDSSSRMAPASINIDGGVFTQVGGDYNNYDIKGDLHQHTSEFGLYTLGQYISHGAIHDSSERFPPPKCHPETRRRVRELIMEWIDDTDPASSVLWLYGPAGAGKSAILQSIAEWCIESGNCSASFFFSRGKNGRDQGRYLFPTIAYQLALNISGLRGHVDQIMASMPGCHMKTMGVQIRTLIIDSLSRLQEHSDLTATVIIDGLDECENAQVQQMILALIADALVTFNVPLRFLIASRPEGHIRESFDSPALRSITRRVALDESFHPDHDIAIYLWDGFKNIYQRNIAIMSHLETPWPTEDVIDLLVQKASGQFIYADTVLKFVGAELCRPSKQLEIVLKNSPGHPNSTDFPDLDALYTQILSTSPHRQTLLLILGVILAFHCPQVSQVIEGILDLEQGEVNLVLRPVLSLVRVPGFEDDNSNPSEDDLEEDGIRFYHASFHDYLIDKDRSGDFYIDMEWAKTQLTLAGFRLITTRVSLRHAQVIIPDPKTWGYLKWHLSPHFWQCREQDRDDIISMLQEAQQQFWKNEHKADPPDDVLYEALHCAVTALVHMMYTKRKWPEIWRSTHYSDVGIDQTLTGLLDEYPEDPEKVLDPILSDIFHQYRDGILDHCYDNSFSSGSMAKLLDSVPGLLVMNREHTYEATALILGVNVKTVADLVDENKTFIRFNQYSSDTSPSIWLKTHPRDYIGDETRSGRHFQNPKLHHIAICHRSLWYTFEQHWSYHESTEDARRYFGINFGRHLEEVNIDPSDDETCTTAVIELLNHLNRLTFCQVPEQYKAHYDNLNIIWFAISRILQWAHRQRTEYSGGSSEIKEKLDFIRNRIYSQILCKEIKDNQTILVVRPHFLATKKRWKSDTDKEKSVWTDSFNFQFACTLNIETACDRVSEDFLLFDEIIPSLTEYITDPSIAGELYIPSDVYHTQFAEYWLERCCARDRARPSDPIEKAKSSRAGRHWANHLIHALPSERIFDRLRNIYDFGLISGTMPFIDSLRLIVSWLETLPEPPLDIYIRWQMAILEQEAAKSTDAQYPAKAAEPVASLSVKWASSLEVVNERWVLFVWTVSVWIFELVRMLQSWAKKS